MADIDTNTNTNTNTNKHIKICVLICFAPPLRRCVAIATPFPRGFAPPFVPQILCRFERRQRE